MVLRLWSVLSAPTALVVRTQDDHSVRRVGVVGGGQLDGLDGLKRGLRFVESKVAVSLAEATAQTDDEMPAKRKKTAASAASSR